MTTTVSFQVRIGAVPDWTDIGANILIFCGSLSDPMQRIPVGTFQNGAHIGSDHPGRDRCGENHCNNVKRVDNAHFSLNAGGTEILNDTNLTANECTMRIRMLCSPAIAISSAYLYVYDGGDDNHVPAPNCEIYAFERGVGAVAWTLINDYSADIGGNNAGQRLSLGSKISAVEHLWYVALSYSPESAGAKSGAKFGFLYY